MPSAGQASAPYPMSAPSSRSSSQSCAVDQVFFSGEFHPRSCQPDAELCAPEFVYSWLCTVFLWKWVFPFAR
eukprot:12365190-Heterocapsa_arctica.AAC.1